jgi:hypothetical protein
MTPPSHLLMQFNAAEECGTPVCPLIKKLSVLHGSQQDFAYIRKRTKIKRFMK